MKSTHRLPQHHRHQLAIRSNPVAKAFSRSVKSAAAKQFESQLLTVRILMLQAQDGDDATELLSTLAHVIGTPCECASMQKSREPWVRQLHGALRTIQTMCMEGYKWQSKYALSLDKAVEVAIKDRHELDQEVFKIAYASAVLFGEDILKHNVGADAVAV
jgi:hypothetical protein